MGRARTFVSSLSLAALLGACGAGEASREDAAGRALAGAPGIVLLCLDTVRADSFDRMPVLSAFARGSTTFVDASSNAAWTAPGVASLLTGLEPSAHGVQGVRKAAPMAGSVV